MLTSQFRNVYTTFNGPIFNEHSNRKNYWENYGRELQQKWHCIHFTILRENELSEPC